MNARFHTYDPGRDFLRIRDFLVETFSLTEQPLNWRLERWNYARYFITPLLATVGVGEPDLAAYQEAIRLFDASTGVWENEASDVIGVVNIEHADRSHRGWGEAFFQRHPDYDFLLPEMLDFAEANLRNRERNLLFIPIYEYDASFQAVVQARGYRRNGEFASFCIAWWDGRNCIAMLEPVGTVPEHRRKGLARAVVLEAIRRVAASGVEQVFVGSDQAFYLSLGFELKYAGHHWKREF